LDGAVEPLDLAVLPRAVRLDAQVSRSDVGDGGLEVTGRVVVLGVVGEDLAHGDAVAGEELGGPDQEAGAGGSGLVLEDLGVGQSAVVVDCGMDVVEAQSLVVTRARGSSWPRRSVRRSWRTSCST
jgi:hypothetical protein